MRSAAFIFRLLGRCLANCERDRRGCRAGTVRACVSVAGANRVGGLGVAKAAVIQLKWSFRGWRSPGKRYYNQSSRY